VLHEFFNSARDAIIGRARLKAGERASPSATEEELVKGMSLIVDHVVETLQFAGPPSEAVSDVGHIHGHEVLRVGLSVSQVVHDYEHVHQAVAELASERGAPLTAHDHRALDHAIAQAVTEYVRLRDQSIIDDENERMGFLVHELRNQLTSATLSFAILKRGDVSINGSTGALHERSLKSLSELIASSLADVRQESVMQKRERILMDEFIEEIEIAGNLQASVRGVELTVEPVDTRIAVEANRLTLTSAVVNLLQNAFKFSRARGTVRLLTHATDDRVFIDIEDECGGLAVEEVEDLFRPYSQRSVDRSGLGLGLSICRRSVRASGGEIHVRDLPGKGCVFTVDLPRKLEATS
jgi:signal transduction histidine kinase